jgi:hypothetical protein
MKNQIAIGISIIAISAVSITSCKKSKTKNELLTEKGWITTSIISQENSNPVVDEFASYLACEKDDITLYKTDGKVQTDAGATKCGSEPQVIDEGTWAFANNETEIISTPTGSSASTFTIVTLTEDALVIRGQIIGGTDTFKVTTTFKH